MAAIVTFRNKIYRRCGHSILSSVIGPSWPFVVWTRQMTHATHALTFLFSQLDIDTIIAISLPIFSRQFREGTRLFGLLVIQSINLWYDSLYSNDADETKNNNNEKMISLTIESRWAYWQLERHRRKPVSGFVALSCFLIGPCCSWRGRKVILWNRNRTIAVAPVVLRIAAVRSCKKKVTYAWTLNAKPTRGVVLGL